MKIQLTISGIKSQQERVILGVRSYFNVLRGGCNLRRYQERRNEAHMWHLTASSVSLHKKNAFNLTAVERLVLVGFLEDVSLNPDR